MIEIFLEMADGITSNSFIVFNNRLFNLSKMKKKK